MDSNQITCGAAFTTVHPNGNKDTFVMWDVVDLQTPEEVNRLWPTDDVVQWQVDTIAYISDCDQRRRKGSDSGITGHTMSAAFRAVAALCDDSPFLEAEVIIGQQLVSFHTVPKDEWLANRAPNFHEAVKGGV